jgi:hypothetical protein
MDIKDNKEKRYVKAQKRVKEVKGFYIHVFVTIFILSVIISANLIFSPEFHWFWFAAAGLIGGVLIHWIVVFGVKLLGFDKSWEDKKIKEFMDQNKNN